MLPWIDDVFMLMDDVSFSFPTISNLHTDIPQHFYALMKEMMACSDSWEANWRALSLEHVLRAFLPKFRYSNIFTGKHGNDPFWIKYAGMRFISL